MHRHVLAKDLRGEGVVEVVVGLPPQPHPVGSLQRARQPADPAFENTNLRPENWAHRLIIKLTDDCIDPTCNRA
jgi:hypothetical protein